MTRPCHAAFLLIPWLLAFSRSAYAAAPETVWLELPDCATPPYQPRELLRSLEIELTPYHLNVQTRSAGDVPPGLRVSVRLTSCDAAAASLTLVFEDGLGQASREHALPLRDIPAAARARTLALVIAEALRPSRSPGEAEERPPATTAPARHDDASSPVLPGLAPAGADPLSAEEHSELPIREFPILSLSTTYLGVRDEGLFETEDPYPGRFRVRIGLDAQARLVTLHNDVLLGLGLNLRGPLLGRYEWALEASYARGNTRTPEGGPQELLWFSGAAGVDFTLGKSRAISFGPRLSLARLEDSNATAVALTSCGGQASLNARLTEHTRVNFHLAIERSLQVFALTPGRDSLPWYGWMLMWGAGASFEI